MKIQLDTTYKKIKVEENVNLKELFNFLNNILKDEWENFTLETNVTINNWTAPIYIEKQYPAYPAPFWQINDNINKVYCLNQSTYNLEVKDGVYLN